MDMDTDIITPSGRNLTDYIKSYRESLANQYNTAVNALNQQRSNDFASIMSNANTAGALYSNFPERDKIKYDTQNYYPSLINLRNTYQTGLDDLRNNVVSLANDITSVQEAISDLNKV